MIGACRQFLILAMAAALPCGAAAERLDLAKPVTLANGQVRFEFEPAGMGLRAMVDRTTGVNHIRPVDGKHLLWEVAFARGRQSQRVANHAQPCTAAFIERSSDGTQKLTLEWNKLRWWLEDNVLTVRVTVELAPGSGIARWRIFVENTSDYWGLWSVRFPLVDGFPAAGVYDIACPAPSSGGYLLRKWKTNLTGRYPSGAWPMQFLALNRGTSGVYFGAMDSDARGKDFNIETGRSLSLTHYPEGMGVAGSDLPGYYPVELGVYQGNWVHAARHYRSWALRQKWTRAGRVSQRDDIPESIRNVGLWLTEGWDWTPKPGRKPDGRGYITARGWHERPTASNAPYLEAQKRMGVPMALHWYHWHHNKFNHEFPNFLPARQGVKERARELIEAGWLVMPYINGYSADRDLPDFARYAPHAALDEAGGYRMGYYGDSAGRLLAMCPTTFWQDRISTLVDRMYETNGFNAVYLDQVSAADFTPCFNPGHGHPVGGGRYWADGYRALLQKVRHVARQDGRRIAVTSEAANEIFFDLLDANLTWAQPSDREIPLMQVVYSGYTLFFASPCDYTLTDRFFRYAQGQALIDGRQNGWMHVDLFTEPYARKADYLRACARYRIAGSKFLTYGDLLGPIEPQKPVPTVEEDGFGWGVKRRAAIPAAEGRLWRSEDGRLGVFLVNYTGEPVPFHFRIDPAVHGVKGARYALTEVSPDGAKPLGKASGAVLRSELLAPAGIRLIEIAPE
jgi:hypothetical protein